MTKTIAIAYGDGIGSEIMESTLEILREAKADIKFEIVEIGQQIYDKGFSYGVMPSFWQNITNNKILLKGPTTNPKNYNNLETVINNKLGIYSNICPIFSLNPLSQNNINLTIISQSQANFNYNKTYQYSNKNYQSLKSTTSDNYQQLILTAFSHAQKYCLKKVSLFLDNNQNNNSEDNNFNPILEIFNEIAAKFSEITSNSLNIADGIVKLLDNPQDFEIIITSNNHGKIINKLVQQKWQAKTLAASANINQDYAIFSTCHGCATDIAGKNIANPTALINAATMMLNHIGQSDIAHKINNALNKTIAQGIHTDDIYNSQNSRQKVSTTEFSNEVIDNLSSTDQSFSPIQFNNSVINNKIAKLDNNSKNKELIGFDLFIDWPENFEKLIAKLQHLESTNLQIKTIHYQNLLLWPLSDKHMMPNQIGNLLTLRFWGKNIDSESANSDQENPIIITKKCLIEMLQILNDKGFDFVKYEGLYK